MTSTPNPDPVSGPSPAFPRSSRTAQALHWLTSVLVLAVLPLAWVATSLARDAAAKPVLFQFHKSVGLTILALVVARILWRTFNPPPPEVSEPAGLALIARVSHWLLYAVFLLMPVSGFLLSAFNGSTTQFFYLFPIPGFEKNEAIRNLLQSVHLAGQWAVYALVLLHIAGTVWHVAIRRDGVLDRMLPEQKPLIRG
ncbi:cytochrome b [Methylorubrum thiocyanatum]|uniref:cytochrome b n=1 Tax=Methylorubrum thiocyanatum TaxID=47958 RepID=UPI003F7E4613